MDHPGETPLKALVVEDEPLLALTLTESLRRIGLEVVATVHDADQARPWLDGGCDIAFIDLYLGRDYGGLDLARTAAAAQTAVVLVTGQLNDTISEALAQGSSVALLAKPYSVEQLRAVVAAVTQGLRRAS